MGLSHNGSEGFERYAERRRGEDAEGTTHRDLGVVLGEVDGILCVEGRLEGGEAGIEGRHEAKMNYPTSWTSKESVSWREPFKDQEVGV